MAGVLGFIDTPDGASPLPGEWIDVRGWAYSPDDTITAVDVHLDGHWLGRAALRRPRPDVAAALDEPGAGSAGYQLLWCDPMASREGAAVLQVTYTLAAGGRVPGPTVNLDLRPEPSDAGPTRAFPLHLPALTADGPRLRGSIDAPDGRAPVPVDGLVVWGWAYGLQQPVSSIDVWLDGRRVGRAGLGRPRSDVMSSVESADAADAALCGFELYPRLALRGDTEASLQLHVAYLDGGEEPTAALNVRLVAARGASKPPTGEAPAPVPSRAVPRRRERSGRRHIVWAARGLDRGGSQLRMTELIGHLSRSGRFTNTVVSPVDGPLRPALEAAGASIVVRPSAPVDDPDAYEAAVSELSSWIDGRFDLVVAPVVTSFSAVDAAARVGLPSVLRIGEAEPLVKVVRWLSGRLHPAIEARARWALDRASVVVSNSHAGVAVYRSDGYTARFAVLGSGVDVVGAAGSGPGDDRDGLRRQLGIDPGQRLLVCAGTLWPVKGQAALVAALRHLLPSRPHLRAVLIGQPHEDFVAALAFPIERHLAGAVQILPFDPDMSRWWRAADVAVCPSESEALPSAVLEAMAYRLPVVGCRVGDLPRLVEPGRTGWLCEPSDVGDLVSVLDDMAATPEGRLRAMGQAGRRKVERAHDRRVLLDRWVELLESAGRRRLPRWARSA